jgi:hypothetical protein
MIKKVVISEASKGKAIAFFEEMKKKKEEAIKKSEARTEHLKNLLITKKIAHNLLNRNYF